MLPAIRIESWEDWTRAYNDVSVWRSLIDEICRRENIAYDLVEAASANTNAVFLLDRNWALKIYSPFWDECDFERSLLEALGSQDEIPVPEVAGSGQIADAGGTEWDYLFTRYCGGRPFSELRSELSDSEAQLIAAQLGGMARRLHELDLSSLATDANRRTWSDVVSKRRRATTGELVAAGVLDAAITGPLETLLDDAIEADLEQSRVVVHGDLGADHVLCSPSDEGWRIEALIDFGDAKIGVAEYEWMPVWMEFCAREPRSGPGVSRRLRPRIDQRQPVPESGGRVVAVARLWRRRAGQPLARARAARADQDDGRVTGVALSGVDLRVTLWVAKPSPPAFAGAGSSPFPEGEGAGTGPADRVSRRRQ